MTSDLLYNVGQLFDLHRFVVEQRFPFSHWEMTRALLMTAKPSVTHLHTNTTQYGQFWSARYLRIVSFSSLANVLLKSFPILLRGTKAEGKKWKENAKRYRKLNGHRHKHVDLYIDKAYFAMSVKSLRCLRALWLGFASVPFCRTETNINMAEDAWNYSEILYGETIANCFLVHQESGTWEASRPSA